MFVRDITDDPSLKIEVLKKAMKKKYNVNVGDQQLYRAKSKAKTMIQGEHKQQYWRLMDYCATLMLKHPGSVAIVVTERFPIYQNPILKGCL